jgi:glycosyltransferase involved in cell wall biosynthesis
MQKISAIIITLNEEKNIARCLQSLQGVADEIVVVDSGSTDGTEEICKKFGVKFISQKWLGYGAQKNFANTFAQYDYILSLDADEVLSGELKKSILAAKENLTANAYEFNRLTNYCGQWIHHCGWYPDAKIRLWKKGKAEWSLDRVHEKVLLAPAVAIQHLAGDILHYTCSSIADHILVVNKYTTYIAEGYFAQKKKVSLAKILFSPLWGFLRDYFFRRGFLDGRYGFMICKISAFATFLKYAKLYQIYRDAKP